MIERFFTGTFGLFYDRSRFLRIANPALLALFKRKHWVVFALGAGAALLNSRAAMPFLLVILLDLNLKKADWKFYAISCAFFILSLVSLLLQVSGIFISTWLK